MHASSTPHCLQRPINHFFFKFIFVSNTYCYLPLLPLFALSLALRHNCNSAQSHPIISLDRIGKDRRLSYRSSSGIDAIYRQLQTNKLLSHVQQLAYVSLALTLVQLPKGMQCQEMAGETKRNRNRDRTQHLKITSKQTKT